MPGHRNAGSSSSHGNRGYSARTEPEFFRHYRSPSKGNRRGWFRQPYWTPPYGFHWAVASTPDDSARQGDEALASRYRHSSYAGTCNIAHRRPFPAQPPFHG